MPEPPTKQVRTWTDRLICFLIGHRWHYYGLGVVGMSNYRQCDRCLVENHYDAGQWVNYPDPAGKEG